MDKEFIILLKKDWNYLLELIDNAYKGNTDIGAVVKQIHRTKLIEDMDNKYTEDDIYMALEFGRGYSFMTDKQFIESLNKQD